MEINVGGKKGLSGFGRVLFVLLALVLIFFVARTARAGADLLCGEDRRPADRRRGDRRRDHECDEERREQGKGQIRHHHHPDLQIFR